MFAEKYDKLIMDIPKEFDKMTPLVQNDAKEKGTSVERLRINANQSIVVLKRAKTAIDNNGHGGLSSVRDHYLEMKQLSRKIFDELKH